MITDTEELTLDEWLISTQEKRDELDAFGKEQLASDTSQRKADIEVTIQAAHDAGKLLSDAESFLVQAQAIAVMTVRTKYPDLSADERKVMAKDAVRTIQRIVDGIAVTVKTLNSRIFSMMNANRSRL